MMKHLLVVLAFGLSAALPSMTLGDERASPSQDSKPFIHPGLLHSRAELDFIKQRIANDDLPWKYAWEWLKSPESFRTKSQRHSPQQQSYTYIVSALQYKPTSVANVVRCPRNNPNIGSSNFARDSIAAYSHALQWWMTDEQAHADKAIEILDAWSETLETISGYDARLLIGMGESDFATRRNLSDTPMRVGPSRTINALRTCFDGSFTR